MRKLSSLIALMLLLPSLVLGSGTVTGSIKTATSGAVKNATLTFQLSQAAIDVTSSFVLAPLQVSCYTDGSGSVVALPDSLTQPNVTPNTALGSVPAGTYFVRIAYYTGSTLTKASPSKQVLLPGTGRLFVAAPALQPSSATGYKIYVGTVDGSETLQATVVGFANTYITSYSVTTAAPTSNNTVCTLTFNDQAVPTFTTYQTNLVDSNGRQIAGFPQRWYLAGSTVNVSTVYPTANTGQVQFPQPVIANPTSNATQSVNSPLTLNGYDIIAGGLRLEGITSHNLSPAHGAVLYVDSDTDELLVSVNGGSFQNLLGMTNPGWTDDGTYVRLTTATDQVVTGQATTDISAPGSITSKGGLFVASGLTNATVGALIYDSNLVKIKSTVTGTGTARNLNFYTYAGGDQLVQVMDTSQRTIVGGLASTDVSSVAEVVNGALAIVGSGQSTNAQVLKASVTAGQKTSLSSDRSGTAFYYPLTFNAGKSGTTSGLGEGLRIQGEADLAGTGVIRNVIIGDGAFTSTVGYMTPLYVRRDQNTPTAMFVVNANNGTNARADISMQADGMSNLNLGISSSGYTNPDLPSADLAYITTDAMNGIFVEAASGDFRLDTNGATRFTVKESGEVEAFYRFSALAAMQPNPIADSGSVQIAFDSGSDKGLIQSALNDGAGAGTGKLLDYVAIEHKFEIGSPGSLTPIFGVTSNGPKFWVAELGAGGTPATFINVPSGAMSGTQAGWLQVELSDGSIGFVPVFK